MKSLISEKLEDLVQLYNSTSDIKKRRLYHIKLVEEGMKLVKKITRSLVSTTISVEDLVQVGSLGLIKAIDNYKPAHNTSFRTFATYYIKGEIKHYVRDNGNLIKIPREVHELIFKISELVKNHYKVGYDDYTSEDIASELNVPVEKVENVLNCDAYRYALSLDQYYMSDDEDTSLFDKLSTGDFEDFDKIRETRLMLTQAIEKLPLELQNVIKLSFFEEYTHTEISQKLNLSRMQVSRRLHKAINALYEIMNV